MPESYLHVAAAQQAAKKASQVLAGRLDAHAFCLGANGPDPFYYYKVWLPAEMRSPDLTPLAHKLHTQKTGEFLLSLIRSARTEAQRSYALGYLSHYWVDCSFHPYVQAMTQPGMPFAGPFGHARLETALDCSLHNARYHTPQVAVEHCVPLIKGAAKAEVVFLLHRCILQVYGQEVSPENISDSLDHMRTVKEWLCSGGRKAALLSHVEPLFGQKGFLTSRMPSESLLDAMPGLPAEWVNPGTGRTVHAGPPALMGEAVRLTADSCFSVCACWAGQKSLSSVAAQLGSRNMITGLER